MSAFKPNVNAYFFEYGGNKYFVDVHNDIDYLEMRLCMMRPADVEWVYATHYGIDFHTVTTTETTDAQFIKGVDKINAKLAELHPKEDAPLPESGEQRLAARVQTGLFFNATTGQLEVK